jgi:hypothetical protein
MPCKQKTPACQRGEHGLDDASCTKRCQRSIKCIAASLKDEFRSLCSFRMPCGDGTFRHGNQAFLSSGINIQYNKTGSLPSVCG